MSTKLPFTKAGLRRAIEAAEAAGKRVLAIRPDGTLIVDNGQGDHPLVPLAADNADALEDWRAEA